MIISGSYIWNAQKKSRLWREGDSTALGQTWGGRLLKKQGYDTYMTGKWHVDAPPAATVFEEVRHIRPGMPRDKGDAFRQAIKKWEAESGDMKDWNDYMPVVMVGLRAPMIWNGCLPTRCKVVFGKGGENIGVRWFATML